MRGAERRVWKVWKNDRKRRELSKAMCELQGSSPSCTWHVSDPKTKALTTDLWGVLLPRSETGH